MFLLKCNHLSYSIGYKKILRDINFEILPGEFVLLTGENGSGKSTLLKLIFGGSKKECFEWTKKDNARPNFSYLGHENGLYSALSLEENLNYFESISGHSESAELVRELLIEFNLNKRLKDPVHTFSEGMKKKSGILRTLLFYPMVLLLDEPFNGLDEKASSILKKILNDYKSKGSVLLITHNPEKFTDVCNKRWNLENGELKRVG